MVNLKKQSQFISVQCSAFGGQRQDEKKGDLKKQSQFVPAQMSATSFVKGDYGNKPACGDEKNKAKQTQFMYRQLDSSLIMASLCKKGH